MNYQWKFRQSAKRMMQMVIINGLQSVDRRRYLLMSGAHLILWGFFGKHSRIQCYSHRLSSEFIDYRFHFHFLNIFSSIYPVFQFFIADHCHSFFTLWIVNCESWIHLEHLNKICIAVIKCFWIWQVSTLRLYTSVFLC